VLPEREFVIGRLTGGIAFVVFGVDAMVVVVHAKKLCDL